MDFQQLLARMNELSQPAPASTAVAEQPVAECPPEMGPGPMGGDMGDMGKPDTPPPSMSVNLNAQGMDNIEDLLKLVTKVNPDMEKSAGALPGLPGLDGAPGFEIEPMDKPAGGLPPVGGLGDLGNLDAGPLKMLPDLDAEEPQGIPGQDGGDDVNQAHGDLDNDGDHDMDDHDMEPKGIPGQDDSKEGGEEGDNEEEEESFGNSVGGSEPEVKGVDAAIPDGNDLNKPKQMSKHSYRQGDNPMAMEGEELRAWIKGELAQRLAEVKGAK